jgi:diadenosine tetraphosphate (Ap4A) HIT family hydrolase
LERNISTCELCARPNDQIVWEDELCYVVAVGGDEGRRFPGYARVVWRSHVQEMTDLPITARRHLINLVFAVETAVRRCATPDKINLASLGNVVPHLHWHVIPRWRDDSHFPSPIWAKQNRATPQRATAITVAELRSAVIAALGEEQGGA